MRRLAEYSHRSKSALVLHDVVHHLFVVEFHDGPTHMDASDYRTEDLHDAVKVACSSIREEQDNATGLGT